MTTVLRSLTPEENRFRFYVITVREGSAGQGELVTRWGRLGCKGRREARLFPTLQAAADEAKQIESKRLRRGYRVVSAAEEA